MDSTDESLPLCIDRPNGIPHTVDQPRARRCEQHRSQRRRWSNANWWRRHHDLPPLPWVPDPLTPRRRQAAVRQFADRNIADIRRSTTLIRLALASIQEAKPGVSPKHWQHIEVRVNRIAALVSVIDDTTQVM